jgi:hypothetical protein
MKYLNSYTLLFKENSLVFIQVLISFLLPIKPLIMLVGMMIGLDTITGIWKSKKLGMKITSHKLSAVVSKIVLYELGIIFTYALDYYIFGEFFLQLVNIPHFLTKMTAIFFVSIEALSLNENIEMIYGTNFFELFKKLLLRTKSLKDEIETPSNNIEQNN